MSRGAGTQAPLLLVLAAGVVVAALLLPLAYLVVRVAEPPKPKQADKAVAGEPKEIVEEEVDDTRETEETEPPAEIEKLEQAEAAEQADKAEQAEQADK